MESEAGMGSLEDADSEKVGRRSRRSIGRHVEGCVRALRHDVGMPITCRGIGMEGGIMMCTRRGRKPATCSLPVERPAGWLARATDEVGEKNKAA